MPLAGLERRCQLLLLMQAHRGHRGCAVW